MTYKKNVFKRLIEDFDLNTIIDSSKDSKKQEKDTFKHLENAAKYAEYDCVTFGLESDDGSIVKVYVKTEDADKFEEALSELLGQYDDIEEAINQIAKDFDIVDVEWPEDEDEDEDENIDPALNKDVYNTKKGDDKINTQLPDSDVTEGQKFFNNLVNEAEVSYVLPHSKLAKEVVYILNELGIVIDSALFHSIIKRTHIAAIKNMNDEDKTAIVKFASRIRLINNNKAIPTSDEDLNESYDFESKFKSKIEQTIFKVVKFLILGREEQDLAVFIKPLHYYDFVQIIKTSKFKQTAYRQVLKNFLTRVQLLESTEYNHFISEAEFETKEKTEKKKIGSKPNFKSDNETKDLKLKSNPKPKSKDTNKDSKDVKSISKSEKNRIEDFENNVTYQELAAKDKNIKLAVDILKWMGFSDDILDSAVVKLELKQNVRFKIKRIMVTPEAKRVKLLWNYDELKLKEAKWTDTKDLDDENTDLELSNADLARGSVISKKFELPDSIDYKPWKIKTGDDEESVNITDGNLSITLDKAALKKLSDNLSDEKTAFIIKDTEESKWVFSKNEKGGYFFVKQGKTLKHFITPLDIDKILK